MTRPASADERRRLALLVDRIAADQGVTPALLASPERSEQIVRVRFALVWAAREGIGVSFTAIGAVLGHRSRATLIHAHRRAQVLRRADRPFRQLADRMLLATDEDRHG